MRPRPTVPTSPHRGLALLVATVLATLGLLAAGTTVAQAHDELVGSTPAPGATLDAAPSDVELEFSGQIQELGTEVLVTGDDGTTVSEGPAQVDGTTVVQPLTADLPAGGYTVDWRATSADGHPLSDRFTFTVTASSTDAAATTTTDSAATSSPPVTTDVGEAAAASPSTSSAAIWIAGAAAVVLLLAALVVVRRLRRRS
jgi:copper resistance protein C